MKINPLGVLFVVAALLAVSGSALAHHGEANYDTTRVISVKGTVTDFQFINPHVQVFMDVKGANGSVEHWICEATSPNMLVREGWDKNTLKPGDVITASGHRAKNGSPTLRLMKIVTADGTEHDHL
jgi:Family of unknown function (DUF6152)